MKPRKRRLGPVWFILLLFIAAIYTYFNAGLMRCFLIQWSDFKEVFDFNHSGYLLYVAPQFPRDKVGLLRSEIDTAKKRVTALYGGFTASPVIIAADQPDPIRKYGVGRDGTAIAHISPAGSYIVLGPKGMDPDVISHELGHCELARRVGILNRFKIPTWFDEGLAMQLDYRPQYAESKWLSATNAGREAPDMTTIAKPNRFYGSEPAFHYILAKHEVGQWLDRAGKNGLEKLIGELKTGVDFGAVYRGY